MPELFDLPDLASYMHADLDTATATLARRIATSSIQSLLGVDPRSFTGTRTVWADVNRWGEVRLPPLLDTVTAVTDASDVAVPYEWRTPPPRVVLLNP
jgi:hypothetical protein